MTEAIVVWEEGKPPDFVLEVASPSSRREDEEERPRKYARMGVPEYFRYDPEGKLEPELAGFELGASGYEPLPAETLPCGVTGVRSSACLPEGLVDIAVVTSPRELPSSQVDRLSVHLPKICHTPLP